MPDPLAFDSSSPRFGLPLLHVGQAQKEFAVNEAHALTDALLHCAIEGESATPPATPVNGTAWLVAASPQSEWAGQAGKLACRQAGQWLFVAPQDGLRLLNRATGQELRYHSAWLAANRPALPSGGTVIDTQARTTLAALLEALETAGIIAAS